MVFLFIVTTKPVISNILEIFAPIIFPDNISDDWFFTEIIPEINSGSDVPIPTIKTPTTNDGSFKYFPKFSAADVKNLAAVKSTRRAIMNMK
jgi:hypothetical protein